MTDYEKSVNDLAQKNSNFTFENKGSDHAAVVVSAMLKSAKQSAIMYSGDLNRDVTSNEKFSDALNEFLETGITFKLLLDRVPDEEEQSEALKKVLLESERSHIIVKKISDDGKKHIENLGHFLLVDSKSYRYETDAGEYKALCNFNDKNIGEKFLNIFNIAFESSTYV